MEKKSFFAYKKPNISWGMITQKRITHPEEKRSPQALRTWNSATIKDIS